MQGDSPPLRAASSRASSPKEGGSPIRRAGICALERQANPAPRGQAVGRAEREVAAGLRPIIIDRAVVAGRGAVLDRAAHERRAGRVEVLGLEAALSPVVRCPPSERAQTRGSAALVSAVSPAPTWVCVFHAQPAATARAARPRGRMRSVPIKNLAIAVTWDGDGVSFVSFGEMTRLPGSPRGRALRVPQNDTAACCSRYGGGNQRAVPARIIRAWR